MKLLRTALAGWFVAFGLLSASAQTDLTIDIPFTKYTLDNGLTLIVHEDHKAPIVAVNVWYHVGSKNEKVGRTGFAHLFEHLMFNGSENFNQDYFQALERIGATNLNGTTNVDRTNYFQNVPIGALDQLLFLESDRMGHLLEAIDQAKLDEQRGVVQNEKRQGENQPYGVAREALSKYAYPVGHPYSWTTIGEMADLNAASLDDVKEWFRAYYGAANATLVIAGDITPEVALEKVKKYFGDIPSGPPVARPEVWIAPRPENRQVVLQDRVPQTRIYLTWNTPQWGTAESSYLDLLGDVLSSGKSSRLSKRLVYDEDLVSFVFAGQNDQEIGGTFQVIAQLKPNATAERVEAIILEELDRLLKDGPTAEELKRIRTQAYGQRVRGLERIGGFGGKSDLLAESQVYGGDPAYYKKTWNWYLTATPAQIAAAGNAWLRNGRLSLVVEPFPRYSNAPNGIDRSSLPQPTATADPAFPKLERFTLSNGLKVVLGTRTGAPLVNFSLLIESGYVADHPVKKPGLANLTANLLDEGTKTRNAFQISEEIASLGGTLGSGASVEQVNLNLQALKLNLEPSLALMADVLLNPAFPEAEFKRLQRQQLLGIQNEKSQPQGLAIRVLPGLMFGDHPYGNPLSGSGTAESVQALTVADVQQFYTTWVKPGSSTLVVTGDITAAELKPLLEKHLAAWAKGSGPVQKIAPVKAAGKPTVYLMDKPGAIQSTIFAGYATVPTNNPQQLALEVMNNVLGGDFTSRINLNLREDKHWSYGAGSQFIATRVQQPFIVTTSVQTDKTKESLVEIRKEMTDIVGSRPITEAEFTKTRDNLVLSLAGGWETLGAVGGSIADIVRYGYADDYYQTYGSNLKKLTVADANAAAKAVINPNQMIYVVVGDLAKIEAGIRELGLGEVTKLDADGKVQK
ncbi:MAG: pitrilysin family protein [Bacteroidia bacterium]|nr:pitrilysin family protein [Bacteroidia bacterium]